MFLFTHVEFKILAREQVETSNWLLDILVWNLEVSSDLEISTTNSSV